MQLLPHKNWWFNMPYGPGLEGMIRQHVPAHVGQGFLLYWVMLWADVNPWKWALIFAIWWELIQRERWRRDKGGNTMPLTENVWDVILSGAGIGLAVLLRAVL